jgi:hypothetical protein
MMLVIPWWQIIAIDVRVIQEIHVGEENLLLVSTHLFPGAIISTLLFSPG